MNRVSKSLFLKYLRCPRAAYFESLTAQLVRDYKKNLSNATNEEQIELLKKEFNQKVLSFIADSFFEASEGEEVDEEEQQLSMLHLLKEDKLLALMNDTYFQIEELSAKRVTSVFGGTLTAGVRHEEQVYGQKIINLFEDGFNFFTFTDVFQEDEHYQRLIEAKATTSRKFIALDYKYKKEEFKFFVETPEGNLMLREEIPGEELHDAYYKKRLKLFDRVGDHGRYVYDLAWQRYIYENGNEVGTKEVKYYLAVLNSKYVYDGKVDDNGRPLYDENQLVTLIDLTKITEEWLPEIAKDFALVKERILNPVGDEVPLDKKVCLYGKGYRECPWFSKCKSDKHVPEVNSIYVYFNGHNGFKVPDTDTKYNLEELVEMGITNALDINYSWLSKTQQIQYKVLESGQTYIDKDFITLKLQDLKYPLYHLDFETMNNPLPMFKGESPYQQSVFQFSLHIEHAPGICDKEKDQIAFLAKGSIDEREALVKALVDAIPNDGKGQVVAYNQGFEKGRMRELGHIFPRYSKDLNSIIDRTIDLMHFIKPSKEIREAYTGPVGDNPTISYYHEHLQRSYSIKKVLPIFVPHLDYALLQEVHNGTDAQLAYLKLPLLSGQEFEKTYTNMLEYCKQDTWAMVEILEALRKLVA